MAGDLREIDMTKATNMDGKKIRLVGDDGKGYWMEKEDLASVVGGLIGKSSATKDGLQEKGYNAIALSKNQYVNNHVYEISFNGTLFVASYHPNYGFYAIISNFQGIQNKVLYKQSTQYENKFGYKDDKFYFYLSGGFSESSMTPLYIKDKTVTLVDVTGTVEQSEITWL